MDSLLILIPIALVVFIVVMPITAAIKAGNAEREAREALKRIRGLEQQAAEQQLKLRRLENLLMTDDKSATRIPAHPPLAQETIEPSPVPPPPPLPHFAPASGAPFEEETELPDHELFPTQRHATEEPANTGAGTDESARPVPAAAPKPAKPAFSIEQFLGVKMFAWLGGVALFFGVIFFVKYAFEHNLIPPALRVAIGFAAGLGLLGGGLWIHRRENYKVPALSLCATGVLTLYGVSFAAHAVYHFPAFGPVATFALMSLITVTALLIAIRLDALVVAVLGMLGGFITPFLLATGHDNPIGLFSYIALLDAGLLAVTWRGRWTFLASAAAAGTVLMQLAWVADRFAPGHYSEGTRTLIPMGIFLFFCVMFLAAAWRAPQRRETDLHLHGAASGLLTAAMGFAFFFLAAAGITERTFLLYGYVLLLNLGAILLAWIHPRFRMARLLSAGATFLHLVLWTRSCLKPEMLGSALAVYLVFGALHAAWPPVSERLRPGGTAAIPRDPSVWMAPAIVALMGLPVFILPHVSFILWPAVLLADLLAIGLAVVGGAILPVLASLVITLLVAAAWLFHLPAETASLTPMLAVVVFFALFFTAAGMWLGKRRSPGEEGPSGWPNPDPAKLLPAASAGMPFLLLILMVVQLPIANPSPVFGAALLLAVLLSGLAIIARQTVLPPAAALCCMALEGTWHATRFNPQNPQIALAWYLGFYALFTVFPFVFRKLREDHTEPWIASSLAGIGHFVLIHDLVRQAHPNTMMGLLPAAFAVPSLLSLLAVLRSSQTMDHGTKVRLSWLGGVALLFITLIFPIQFDRQWLTVSWALEGACLVWLFRRIPHSGLLWTGLVLSGAAFVRLTFNPAVFSAYPRSGTPVFNWHLYTYGIVAAAQCLGAWWLPEARRRFQRIDLSATLWSFGGILLFLLLNIEIADYFTAPGERFIAFEFAGNFGRDMTYTISWGLFALALLITGIWFQTKGARLAAIALLAVTLLKLFLHDLATIGNIYRIAALIATGLIAFLASFLYQRFFTRSAKP